MFVASCPFYAQPTQTYMKRWWCSLNFFCRLGPQLDAASLIFHPISQTNNSAFASIGHDLIRQFTSWPLPRKAPLVVLFAICYLLGCLLRICRWLVMYRAQAGGAFGLWGPWLCALGAITPPFGSKPFQLVFHSYVRVLRQIRVLLDTSSVVSVICYLLFYRTELKSGSAASNYPHRNRC